MNSPQRRTVEIGFREALGIVDAAREPGALDGLPQDLDGLRAVDLADLEARCPATGEGEPAVVQDALLVIYASWRLARALDRNDAARAAGAAVDVSQAIADMRASAALPEHAGWLRWDAIVEDARRGRRVTVKQRSAARAGAEERRSSGDSSREKTNRAWHEFVDRKGRTPSGPELARTLKLHDSSVRRHVRALKKSGHIPR